MIGGVGHQPGSGQLGEARGAGKRADAVGQQAKVILALSRDAGGEVPPNARGLASSAIARGIDPASLFASRVGNGVGGPAQPPVPAVDDGALGVAVANRGGAVRDDSGVEAAPAGEAGNGAPEKSLAFGGLVISEDPSLALLLEADAQTDV